MKKMLMVATIMCMMLTVGFGTVNTTCAKEIESVSEEEVSTYAVQPRMMCLECTSIMQMLEICLSDSRTYSGTREHSYGLLWSKTCTVTSYEAMAAYYCDVCGNTIMFEDSEQSDGYARHHCLEVHSSCGSGNYVVCPFGG